MSETIQETTPAQQEATEQTPFVNQAWTETPPTPTVQDTKPVETDSTPSTDTPPKTETTPTQEEIVDVKEWVKREYGWDDPELGKKELAELRQKAQTPAEIKFANEASEKFFSYLKEGKEDEIYSYLDTKRKLSTVDKLNAIDAIKLHIAETNKHFKHEDVQDIFEEKYSMPSKPVREDLEEDADFEKRVSAWQSNVDKITRRIERDSVTAKQELAKLNSELILPDIKKEPEQPKSNPEALVQIEKLRAEYLRKLESDYKNFNGYETKYKDEEVEIPVSFAISDEDKIALKNELESFDVDGFITERWFDKEGNPNIKMTMDDVFFLRNKEKIIQKLVNEVGTKMREHYIKLRSNINLNNGTQTSTFQPSIQQQNGQAASPFSAGAWSEKPPVITNN